MLFEYTFESLILIHIEKKISMLILILVMCIYLFLLCISEITESCGLSKVLLSEFVSTVRLCYMLQRWRDPELQVLLVRTRPRRLPQEGEITKTQPGHRNEKGEYISFLYSLPLKVCVFCGGTVPFSVAGTDRRVRRVDFWFIAFRFTCCKQSPVQYGDALKNILLAGNGGRREGPPCE